MGFDEAVAEVDVEDGGGVNGAVAKVGVAHHVAGETLSWLEVLVAMVDDAADDRPVFNTDDWLIHGGAPVSATGRFQPSQGPWPVLPH